jgi:hypothetical protein
MRRLGWIVAGVVIGLAAAAISKEMEKPPAARTWQGTVAGVPYNFNLANWVNTAGEYWNPASDQILTPHAIGLGWGINVAALVRRVEDLVGAQQAPSVPKSAER